MKPLPHLSALALALGLSVSVMADTTTSWSRTITQAEFAPNSNTFELLASLPDLTSFTVNSSGGGASGFFLGGTLDSNWLVGDTTPMPVGPGLTTAGLTVSTLDGPPGAFTWTFGNFAVFGPVVLPANGVTITGSYTQAVIAAPVPEPTSYAMLLLGLVGLVSYKASRKKHGTAA